MKSGIAAMIVLLAGVCGCETSSPDERARRILEEHGDDEARARSIWREDSANWHLGLDDRVAWRDPVAPLTVRTTRDLSTGRCDGDGLPVHYQTAVVDGDGRPLAGFRWDSLDASRIGHRQVRGAVAAARGDPDRLRQLVEEDSGLARARLLFRQSRDLCHSRDADRQGS